MNCLSCVFVLALLVGSTIALSGQFIPKSFYVIDREGHQSDLFYVRTRRDSPFDFLDRARRSAGGGSSSSASSFSSASASSSSSSGGGGGGAPIYYGDGSGYVPPNYGQGGYSALNYNPNFPPGATIFSRFGEEAGTGVQASGNAQGPKGAFSAVSTSSQDGKVQYAVKSGKY